MYWEKVSRFKVKYAYVKVIQGVYRRHSTPLKDDLQYLLTFWTSKS